MRVAVVQMNSQADLAKNLDLASGLVTRAAEMGAELVALPENFAFIGESDELGYIPKSRPVTPAEVAATLYHALGLDPHKELPGPQGRPFPLVDFGKREITELF